MTNRISIWLFMTGTSPRKDAEYASEAERLGLGGIDFRQWQLAANQHITTGTRIIGVFDQLKGTQRLRPYTASCPDNNRPHTIIRARNGDFTFLYQRTGTIHTRYGSGPPKNRAGCTVVATDEFLLNLDAVRLEHIRFFRWEVPWCIQEDLPRRLLALALAFHPALAQVE